MKNLQTEHSKYYYSFNKLYLKFHKKNTYYIIYHLFLCRLTRHDNDSLIHNHRGDSSSLRRMSWIIWGSTRRGKKFLSRCRAKPTHTYLYVCRLWSETSFLWVYVLCLQLCCLYLQHQHQPYQSTAGLELLVSTAYQYQLSLTEPQYPLRNLHAGHASWEIPVCLRFLQNSQ